MTTPGSFDGVLGLSASDPDAMLRTLGREEIPGEEKNCRLDVIVSCCPVESPAGCDAELLAMACAFLLRRSAPRDWGSRHRRSPRLVPARACRTPRAPLRP